MNTTQKFRTLFQLPVFLLLAAYSVSAQTWNAANDFSPINNPDGVWRYGYETTLGGALNLYNTATTRGSPLNFWNSSGIGTEPTDFHNSNSIPENFADFTLQPNQTAFHPGRDGEFSIFRWMAPSSGLYSIQVDFVGLGAMSTTDPHVLINGTSIFNGVINGTGTTTNFNTTISLLAGNTVDFAIGFGSDNVFFSDTTGINATIVSVPEPSSLALLAFGVAPMIGWRSKFFRSYFQ